MFTYEIKYLITADRAEEIRDWVRTRIDADPHGAGESGDVYHVRSLYFDTEDFDVFYRRGSFGRSKYRIRRYESGEATFLERKLRRRNKVSKRRSIVGLGDLERLANDEAPNGWEGYWFHRRLLARRLMPICQISYRRIARVSMTDLGPIRLTIDQNVHALPVRVAAFDDPGQGPCVSGDRSILELKYRQSMPAVFKHLVETFALEPQAVSKYRLAAVALGCVPATSAVGAEALPDPSPCLIS